ncbi:MAG: BamA/OMP85 family outer membrane protein [Myxococcota bacterium]
MSSPFALIALLAGCPKPAGDVLRRVQFEGNEEKGELTLKEWLLRAQSDKGLRNAISQPVPANFLSSAPPLSRDTLDEDAWRVEVWYANHGYFDARFLGWTLTPRARSKVGPGLLRRVFRPAKAARFPVGWRTRWIATGHVEQGRPSRVRAVDVRGLETLMAPTRARVLESLGVAEGDVWSTSAWEDTLDGVRAALLDRSYAHVRVDGRVDVHADEHAVDATIDVVPGPRCRFGSVTIINTSADPRVKEVLLRNAISIEEGKPFNTRDLAETRARLFALQVFGVVDVVPDLSEPDSAVVPVRIELRETLKNGLTIGPGLEADSTSGFAAFLRAEVDAHNTFGALVDMHHETRMGYAAVLNPATEIVGEQDLAQEIGPIVAGWGEVHVPWVFGRDVSLSTAGGFEVGIEPGYRFWTWEALIAPTWTPLQRFSVTVGPRIRYYRFYDVSIDLAALEDSPLGLDTRESYLLALLEQRLTYDGRNDALSPTRGWYWSVALAEAGLFSAYHYVGAQGEVRAYRSIVRLLWWDDPGTVVAGRLGGGVMVPYGDTDVADVPIAERLYLGGGTSVRGWGAKRLGPYVQVEERGGCGDECEVERVPVGGELSLHGTAEVRQALLGSWGVVGFVDAGRVWNKPRRFDPTQIQVAVGAGLRYTSPVGPVRLDVATRLGEPDYFDDKELTDGEPKVTVHFGLSEAF